MITVFGSVGFGYISHGGSLHILYQPAELLIILGVAAGSIIISYPWYKIKKALFSIKYFFNVNPYSKKDYMEIISLCVKMFKIAKQKGNLELEKHVESYESSNILGQSKLIKNDSKVRNFILDNFRLITMGIESSYQFEDIIDQEIVLIKDDNDSPASIFSGLGDSLPALGIVAAVAGVIITMKNISEPAETIGALIGASLVGTFMGVLFAYGLFAPMGSFMYRYSNNKTKFLLCIKSGFISYLNGNNNSIIAEYMRKNTPEEFRPSFDDLENKIRSDKVS
ncbi:MAG TPA: MotA/TolQ/ExbB proton channel family protein [Candidatus Megaira endosymbiont of Hartmannula sinica]|nr:MotA/TolQ/ExbB proton channel family protein [Candidatus Megaera endosymbiont of Hartmannula sinica]